MLRKYVADPSHIIDFYPIVVQENVTYVKLPASILDCKEKVLRSRTIPYMKTQWQRHSPQKATWELEEDMTQLHPQLFD